MSNLLTIGAACSGRSVADWEADLAGHGYGDLKKAVSAAVLDVLVPFQQRYRMLLDDPAELDRLLATGAERAAAAAAPVLATVYDRVGFLPRA